MLDNNSENLNNFSKYFIKIYEDINNIYRNTLNNENTENVYNILKIYEKKVLFDLIYLSPISISRETKSHRKALDEKKILINCNALSYCRLDKSIEIGSYIDIDNKKLIHSKSNSIALIEYDLTKIWDSIHNIIRYKKEHDLEMYLFTDDNSKSYPLYYKNSNKKHCGFQNNSYKLIKQEIINKFDTKIINDLFRNITSLNQIFKEISASEIILDKSINTDKIIKKDEMNYNNMWKEIFETIGMLPKDCPCKAYSKAVYNRCVIYGKSLRGIRPKHSKECSKKNSTI